MSGPPNGNVQFRFWVSEAYLLTDMLTGQVRKKLHFIIRN
jgi:hypothetical protein